MDHVRVEVTGEAPPAKSEATSLFGVRHPHRARVEALLRAAEAVMAHVDPIAGDIAIDVIVTAPLRFPLNDATNLLGGIGDVLQTQQTNADVTHLGKLALVGCFLNDDQIREIRYRRVYGDELGYVVEIQALEH